MQRIHGRLIFSPSDLTAFLDCEHLTQLERDRDPLVPRPQRDAQAELLAGKGTEHEKAWLDRFAAEGRPAVVIRDDSARGSYRADAKRTIEAMKRGDAVIYQGVFVHGNWRGIGDFLVRVETPSALGEWSYEVWDTKLARHTKPYFVLQLCFYTEQLCRIQETAPEWMRVVLGTGQVEALRFAEFEAYYRSVRRRFLEAVKAKDEIYPYPVSHCGLCSYHEQCESRREQDDHLSGIANMRRQQVERLEDAGIATIAALASAPADLRTGIGARTLDRLRQQARLQVASRTDGMQRYELLPVNPENGFRLLPQPSDGDVFFDMEGDPYYEAGGGLEYLFGLMTVDGGSRRFTSFLGLDRAGEKAAFEQFIDYVMDRLSRWPDMHVYHYAPYETSAVKRLRELHETRGAEVDDLLRRKVFVDLYQVVRQAIRISYPSYSIKKVRLFFMEGAGEGAVTEGGDSIVEFERWRTTGDEGILKAIIDYNEEDCLSTVLLREWLVARKHEAEQLAGVEIPWMPIGEVKDQPKRAAEDAVTKQRREQLTSLGSAGAGVLASLLEYHRREARPEWWAYFDRSKKTLEELFDDSEAIVNLVPAPDEQPQPVKNSVVHPLDFPPQEYKLKAGDEVIDPLTGKNAGSIERVDAQRGRLYLRRGPSLKGPAPLQVAAPGPLDDAAQRAAIGRVADAVIAGSDGYAAIRAILGREFPRVVGRTPGEVLQTMDLEEQKALVAKLDRSYLFIQGPPGSGKTWTGARLVVSLIQQGHRVGVAAVSHKAINNLLKEIEEVAVADKVAIRGLKKISRADDSYIGRVVENTRDNEQCETDDVQLIAGTAWLFSREGMDGRLDYLFVDEAGQVSLADAVAMSTAARNVVFLGDPQQLPQITQGTHPSLEAQSSILEYLLDEAITVDEHRGIFQERTYRMHPDVCSFVSELSYEGRLHSDDKCRLQRVQSPGLSGAGPRLFRVPHEGNGQQSREEAQVIAREVKLLLDGGRFWDVKGGDRLLTAADILVVAPYNMQVNCLRDVLPAGVEVGTVDKFQGREAPVVFFSMASSSGEDVPRGLEFLLSRNRLNVALSRARALAVIVCSPHLLDVKCVTVEQMRLANALCRFAEQPGVETEWRSSAWLDRAVGALVGTACGDALGAPHEFQPPLSDDVPLTMRKSANWSAGEWTDDTTMAWYIAKVAADGMDLATSAAQDRIVEGWMEWLVSGPKDIGIQTRSVLSGVRRTPTAAAATAAAAEYFKTNPMASAGNGSLMRTAPVAIALMDRPDELWETAQRISALTHADPVAGEACAIWCMGIRTAVMERSFDGVPDALDRLPADRATYWRARLREAETGRPSDFKNNGWVVAALQAAWSAIVANQVHGPQQVIEAAVRCGNDTDTVGAIAGMLAGARWGASALPADWVKLLHGFPHATGKGLIGLVESAYSKAIGFEIERDQWVSVSSHPGPGDSLVEVVRMPLAWTGIRVFMLDDDADRSQGFRDAMDGAEITVASSRDEAITRFTPPYDLVCVDHLADGYEFAYWLPPASQTFRPTVVVQTRSPNGTEDIVRELRIKGFKPMVLPVGETMLRKVGSILRRVS